MKVATLFIITNVILVTNAITVPPVWPKSKSRYNHRPQLNRDQYQHYKNAQSTTKYSQQPALPTPSPWLTVQPQAYYKHDTPQNFYESFNTHTPPHQVINQPKRSPLYIKRAQKPAAVEFINVRRHPSKLKPPERQQYNESRQKQYKSPPTHDPQSEEYRSPLETPRDVPTKPIYPGKGQWAKPGKKHTPHIHIPYETIKEDEQTRPDGYEIFQGGQKQFQNAQNKFKDDLKKFPKEHRLQESKIDDGDESEPIYEKPELEFVPQKLYAQVRRTENEEHLPRSAISEDEEENAGRLRKVLRDSRIHTVYTEEGYEDSAYDHAGHEKKAENSEGHAVLDEGEKKSNYKSSPKDQDSEAAGSEPRPQSIKTTKKVELTKDMTETIMKNTEDGPMGMQIHTEIKISGPNKKKHKFVKIIPYQKMESDSIKGLTKTQTNLKTNVRVKRYDRGKLSKRFVRKRPKYYWQKNKTVLRTTLRPSSLFLTKPSPKSEYTTKKSETTTQRTTTTTEASTQSAPNVPKPSMKPFSLFLNKPSKNPNKPSKKTISTTTTESAAIVQTETSVNADIPETKVRRKRFTINYPNVDVNLNEFVDVRKLPEPATRQDLTHIKYPYFNLKTESLHEYSPLRYAENLSNVPKKAINELAFYESRNHIQCDEIVNNVDPIPEHVKNKRGEEDEDDNGEEPPKADPGSKIPRLRGLNDKIDCLKIKYFGENPLDSPFFQEEVIEPPVPSFFQKLSKPTNEDFIKKFPLNGKTQLTSESEIQVKNKHLNKSNPIAKEQSITPLLNIKHPNQDNIRKVLLKSSTVSPTTEINLSQDVEQVTNRNAKRNVNKEKFKPIVVGDDENVDIITINPIHEETEAVLKPPYTLKEMVDKMEKDGTSAPKNIYDQISLLEGEKIIHNTDDKSFIIVYNNKDGDQEEDDENTDVQSEDYSLEYNADRETELEGKIKNLKTKSNENTEPKLSDIIPDLGNLSEEIPRAEVVDLVPENFTEKDLLNPNIQEETNEQNEKNYKSEAIVLTTEPPTTRANVYSSKYRQQNNLNLNHQLSPLVFDITQYLPKIIQNTVLTSEVHYKDEIKPSEQMGVFIDVLKNIKSAESKDAPIVTQEPDVSKNKTVGKREEMKTYKVTSKSTIQTTPEPEVEIPKNHKKEQSSYPYRNFQNKPIPLSEYKQPANYNVGGLFPPTKILRYRTILPKNVKLIPLRITRNNKRIYILKLSKPITKKSSKKIIRRIKRQIDELDDLEMDESEKVITYVAPPSRKVVYTEIMRPKPPKRESEDDEEEEDLLPKKRVYDISPVKPTERNRYRESTTPLSISSRRRTETPKKEEDKEDEEVKPTVDPKVLEAAPSKDDPSIPEYIYLINKYHIINPPTTTTTTPKPESTTLAITPSTQMTSESIKTAGQPEFLQIINHLHQIKMEEEEKHPKVTPEISETPSTEPIKNSNPFISYETVTPDSSTKSSEITRNYNDPDDQSRIRNFSSRIRTSIDTSKYKSIERPTTRHSISSRFNSEEEDTPLEVTSTTTSSISDKPSTTESTTKISTSEVTTPRKRMRTRTRSTTLATSASVKSEVTTHHPTYRRRRPTTLRATTQPTVSTTKYNPIEMKRRHRLRLDTQKLDIPSNHKAVYTPIANVTNTTAIEGHVKKRRIDQLQIQLNDNNEEKNSDLIASKKSDFEIIAPLTHTDTRHGGNYKHIDDVNLSNPVKVVQGADVSVPVRYFMDPTLATNVNQLKDNIPEKSSVFTTEQPVRKQSNDKINLYPNMARLVNRLAVVSTTPTPDEFSESSEEDGETTKAPKPKFIKDPSRRLYYYAKL